jgi:hypothetical protein
MKSWLAKFRISSALDSPKPLRESLQRKINGSRELGQFVAQATSAGEALRKNIPKSAPPPALHSAIMSSLRAAEFIPYSGWRMAGLAAPAAVAMLLTATVWWNWPRPQHAPTPSISTSTALEFGSRMPETLPAAVVAPLSEELEKVNLDINRAAQFLVASLP